MALLEWNESLSVGFGKMDEEHQRLVDMVNNLDDALSSGQDSAMVGELLDDLISHTLRHFHHEEHLMQAYGDPEYIAHKIEHTKLTRAAMDRQVQFLEGHPEAVSELLPFLKEWLTEHIHGIDAKTGRFLAEHDG